MSTVRLPLRLGQYTSIDATDLQLIEGRKLYLHIDGHLLWVSVRLSTYKSVSLHRLIMDAPAGMVVDHIDGDGLNNTRENLRICTQSQNHMNKRKALGKTSKFKGVHFDRCNNRWLATIKIEEGYVTLGRFKNEIDAAIAYNDAAIRFYREYACLNIIDENNSDNDGAPTVPVQTLYPRKKRPLPIPHDHPNDPDSCLIDLTRGYQTTINRSDSDEVCKYLWWVQTTRPMNIYAVGYVGDVNERQMTLHAFLMKTPPGMFTDHINGDGLDNRRANLRIVSSRQNSQNARHSEKTGNLYKGVKLTPYGRYEARIFADRKYRHLGTYSDPIDAARAYNVAAKEAFGEFARLNDI